MTMTLLLTRYASTLTMRYEARDAGNFEQEDHFLDQLDLLWLEMSDMERRACDEVARVTKQRHRMHGKFVATVATFSYVRNPNLLSGLTMFCGGAMQGDMGGRELDLRACIKNNTASNSSIPFEPRLAYG